VIIKRGHVLWPSPISQESAPLPPAKCTQSHSERAICLAGEATPQTKSARPTFARWVQTPSWTFARGPGRDY